MKNFEGVFILSDMDGTLLNSKGEIEEKRYVDFTIVTDERILDGYGYAQGFKMMKNLILHPEQLDVPPEKVVEDIP